MNEENNFEEKVENDTIENNDNSEKSSSTKKNIKKKKMVLAILIVCIVISVIAIILGVVKIHKQNNQQSLFDTEELNVLGENELNKKQKKFMGIDDSNSDTTQLTYKEEKNYTDAYKKYLELPEKEKKELEVIPREEEIPIETLDEIEEEIPIEDTIPSSFNLADKINLHVSNQGSYGLCWDFASIKTLETFLALHEQKDYDLSEIHVDYLTSSAMYDQSRDVHNGGSFDLFQDYLQLTGPVLENKLEYRDYNESEYKNFIDMEPVARVTKTVEFPSLNSDATEEQKQEFRNLIKSHIMKNGSLYATTSASTIKNGYDESYDGASTNLTTQYCNDICWSDHAISIVGWDDNFSKEYFTDQKGKHPEKDGAYIALNSWGSDWGNNGYFYISYEDMNVELQMSGILSTSVDNSLKIDSISNPTLKNYLKEHYGQLFIKYNNEDYLSGITLQNIRTIKLENANLSSSDLEEIAALFPNLWQLKLANNNIDDISALNKFKNEWIDVDLANNKITNISTLTANNISTLNLDGNRIVDINPLNNLSKLISINLSNNPINWNDTNLTSANINQLIISNTNFTSIDILNNVHELGILDISKNPITSLDGIQNFHLIFEINVSETQIRDFSLLNRIKRKSFLENSEEYNMDVYIGDDVSVIANNCGIDDITLFNDIKIDSLTLENNNIKDVSKFKNDRVMYINLSGNNDLTGLQGLKDVSSIILSKTNLTSLDEVLNLTNVVDLDLSYNSLQDFSSLEQLKDLHHLSLEGMSNIKIDSIPSNLSTLNVKNCNLDNNVNFSNFKDLQVINISNNPNFTNFKSLTNIDKEIYRNIFMGGYQLSVSDLEEINKLENLYIYDAIVNLGYTNLNVNQNIPIDFGSWTNKFLMKNMLNDGIVSKDLVINKNAKEITITGPNSRIYIDSDIYTNYSNDIIIGN